MRKCVLAVILFVMALVLVPHNVSATSFANEDETNAIEDASLDPVEINQVNFPDIAFRQFITCYDTDGDGLLSI